MVHVMDNQEAALSTIEALLAQERLKCSAQELMFIIKGIIGDKNNDNLNVNQVFQAFSLNMDEKDFYKNLD